MKKLKRISAALMVILLAGLFIAAIVLMTRVLKKDDSKDTSDTSLKK